MASKAFDNAQKAMDAATEARLAYLVMQDALQLQERAVVEGVTAYNRKPVQRERPNERFLHRTIKSVEFANRRSQEDEMWHRRQLQLEREERHGRQRSARRQRAHGNTSGTDLDDEELARDAKQRRAADEAHAQGSGLHWLACGRGRALPPAPSWSTFLG
ncbi:hypothetical protein WJX72_004564 [[Myrmecia] bisecta]|uniref:Uncharacterized protein n=1 Tax=[Myrmecia] bisecta TaxID=41462 RepID=A0AAW1PSP8_9CHLO